MTTTAYVRPLVAATIAAAVLFPDVRPNLVSARAALPAAGDIIINEYMSDNDSNDNDFFELLVLGNGVDLRGLRVSDNELVGGTLNNGETVFVFGNEPYLSAVPGGTTIAVWTARSGVTVDTVVNPTAGDWKMVLAPGTGVTTGSDRLGGDINPGLANGGDALYLYLPGPNGDSTGRDNVYLDFVSWEDDDGADPPAGMPNLNLAAPADNGYFTGSIASANDTPASWVRYNLEPNVKPTVGEANLKQDLSRLRKR
jgi:hypothetical protein